MGCSWQELTAVIIYFVAMLAVGIYFFLREKKEKSMDEKEYFLGGRKMNGWVAAFSAGASDMSAWVLMGLPGAIYLNGIGEIWISVGLIIGTISAWIFVAPRLRRYSIIANDSITLPQFLTNRFQTRNLLSQVVSAMVFVAAYCVYAASSFVACGKLFNTLFGISSDIAIIIAIVVIVSYTFMGGFNAVCWTDFFQGLLMLGSLMITPIIAVALMEQPGFESHAGTLPANFYSLSSGGSSCWSQIVSGLGWGLGYFGMPHILVRYFSISSEKEMRKSQIVGSSWTFLILIVASLVGIIGRYFLPEIAQNSEELVFVKMVRVIYPLFIGGIFLSAILAASMSTADSQLLLSSSAFVSDFYKPVFRKKASPGEILWCGRIVVLLICVIAYFIAINPKCESIMGLVSCAWAAFGGAFGPVVLLALYWKRMTYFGSIASIFIGFVVDVVWHIYLTEITGVYEIVPAFICGLIACVVVSLLDKKPAQSVIDDFEKAKLPIKDHNGDEN